MFLELKSAALNPVSTMGELMTNVVLCTVIGIGVVLVVLKMLFTKSENRPAKKHGTV